MKFQENLIVDTAFDLYTSEVNRLTWISDELRLLCVLGDDKRRALINEARKLPNAVLVDNG